MNRNAITIGLLVLIIGGTWLFYSQKFSLPDSEMINQSHSRQMAVKRMDFTLSDLEGQQQNISRWDKHVILINFWATWCPPCQKEIPDFVDVYNEYREQGFTIIGIGIDDREHIADFVETLGVNYPILVGEKDAMRVSYQYGNRHGALPYSVIIDKKGMIRYKKAGLISRNQLVSLIEPLL